jgi:glycosyltransferase involved in cell wall biosynthesis
MGSKKKILMISDHPLSVSGVGCQSRYLIQGLVKTNKYSFRCLGAAKKHQSYDRIKVNDDFIIKPIDGFGNQEMIRYILATERPDAMVIFTDPRFFTYLLDMEDEIHQQCPIAWWHVWDNWPWPEYNRPVYESVDLFNCHSHMTYEMVKEKFPEKTNFIPHAIPPELFRTLPEEDVKKAKAQLLGEDKLDWLVGLWINRNAKRKRPNDLLLSWKMFVDDLEAKHGHRKAMLMLHTDPMDIEGPNLFETVKMLGIGDNVAFSTQHVEFENINMMHNISDFYVNISFNEGFGLGTLESMQVGNPIIAVKTGGQTRQVVNHSTGEANGVALDVDVRSLVGSQTVPYIFEDYASNENISKAFMEMFEFGPEGRKRIGDRAKAYVESDFNLKDTISEWDRTLGGLIKTWNKNKEGRKQWTLQTL